MELRSKQLLGWVTHFVLLGLVAMPASAQLAVPVDLQAMLNAGEFGPALALARQQADPAGRDAMLAAIAVAQAKVGAAGAAQHTIHSLSDDRYRTTALDQISAQPVTAWPARGGGTMADFDTLIQLITSTIAPQTWDAVGGPGAIDGFPGGVFVDSSGQMKQVTTSTAMGSLSALRAQAQHATANRDYRRDSALRKVSLTRLERDLATRNAFGQPPTEAMQMFAGLSKIEYILVYPDTGDIVLAGPAGDWQRDQEGRAISKSNGRPVLQLDDFVVVLRNAIQKGGRFTCSITPRQQNLAATQAFLQESAKTPLRPGQRESWLNKIRDLMGAQVIEVEGIDADTHAARVIVEADYRMKLVGMGLEESVFGVTSYLDSIIVPPGGSPPPMSVLRWWFTMNYDAIRATSAKDAFQLRGTGVQVLSENEMLTQQGQRVHTGQSDELNRQFAHSFTKQFSALATKYPVYAELQNVFDLALVAALLLHEDLPGQVGWHMTHFADPNRYVVTTGPAATEVETVINHRVVQRKHVIAGVSGGVAVDSNPYVQAAAMQVDNYGDLIANRDGSTPPERIPNAWWWD